MENFVQFPDGDNFATRKITVSNRTGGTLVLGQPYALDISAVQAETTSVKKGLGNITPPATANLASIMVVALAGQLLADNETGLVASEGEVSALVDGTTDVAIGDSLTVANAGAAFVKASTGNQIHARALEARTTNSAGLMKVMLLGWPKGVAA